MWAVPLWTALYKDCQYYCVCVLETLLTCLLGQPFYQVHENAITSSGQMVADHIDSALAKGMPHTDIALTMTQHASPNEVGSASHQQLHPHEDTHCPPQQECKLQ